MEERRSRGDRRSNWTEALIRLRLPDSTLMALAEEWTDLVRDSARDGREGTRLVLLDLIVAVRERAGKDR